MERFFWKDNPVVATVYAPIIFPPASVLMFKQLRNGNILLAFILNACCRMPFESFQIISIGLKA